MISECTILDITLHIQLELRNGRSLQNTLAELSSKISDPKASALTTWYSRRSLLVSEDISKTIPMLNTNAYRSLLLILDQGLKGSPIQNHLIEFEREILQQAEYQLDAFVQKLPLKLLIPLMFFILPALMLLLIGPLLGGLENV